MNLKIQSFFPFLLTACLALMITSCGEDELPDIPDPTDPPVASTPTPELGDGFGGLWAINSVSSTSTPIGNVDTELGTAVAFFSNDNFSTFEDAGTVSVATTDLSKVENNSYVHIPSALDPTGIAYPSTYNWEIAGSGAVPAFTTEGLSTFPSVGNITSPTTVNKANGYTLSCESVSDAQEVLFLVGGVSKTVSGNGTEAIFTSADLGGLDTGMNFVQVAAYTYEEREIEGKMIWVGVETVRTVSVEIE